jgi:hypothetical protein
MIIHYTLRGSIEVPDGSKLTDTETGIVLPDGTILKMWEQWEHHASLEDDHPRDLSWSELAEFQCFYDGAMAEFSE